VTIEGNHWVSDEYVAAVLQLGRGYYNAYEIDAAVRRLAAAPAIRTVRPSVEARGEDCLALLIRIEEERPYSVAIATRFTDIDDYFGVGFQFNEYNPTGLQCETRAMLGLDEQEAFLYQRLSKGLLRGSLRIDFTGFHAYKSRDDLDYVFTRQEVHELGAGAAVDYRLTPGLAVRLGAFGKRHRLPAANPAFTVQEGVVMGMDLRADFMGLGLSRLFAGLRDSHTIYYQESGLLHGGDFDFSILQVNSTIKSARSGEHSIQTDIHAGWVWGAAPPQELLSLGGMTTMPGYPDDSFIGARMLLIGQNLHLSARSLFDECSAWSPFSLGIYAHAGAVWKDAGEGDSDRWHHDIGVELDYMKTLRLGIAWPLGSRGDFDERFYFGWAFHVL
jgi:hypothetical protein